MNMSTQFKGSIGRTWQDSKPWWPQQVKAPVDAPNIAYIILDDVGYGWLSCYGGPIDTPNIDKLAANGLLYNNWHTTALCSPTRACLLTGRNHHSDFAETHPGRLHMDLPDNVSIRDGDKRAIELPAPG